MQSDKRKSPETGSAPSDAQTPVAHGTPESIERRRRIEDLAYSLAERRGFADGAHEDDWLEAERQVDGGSKLPVQAIDHD